MKDQIIRAIEAVGAASPLVHSITNFVVMNVTANALLAAHASPLMAHAAEEMDDLTDIDAALVLNIGTLDPVWLDSMELAGKLMRAKGKPVVLDPVGAGASGLRTEASLRLLDMVRPQIVRGNASEIMALAAAICRAERLPSPSSTKPADAPATKGVDSLNDSREAVDSARFLASRFSCVVSISGQRDFITDGKTVLDRQKLEYGSRITYKGADPARAPDAQYVYTFAAWVLSDGTRKESSGFAEYKKETVKQ